MDAESDTTTTIVQRSLRTYVLLFVLFVILSTTIMFMFVYNGTPINSNPVILPEPYQNMKPILKKGCQKKRSDKKVKWKEPLELRSRSGSYRLSVM